MANVGIVVAIAILVASCASSSGALMIGQDTYALSASASPGRGGLPAAKQIAYSEANAECSRHQKSIELIDEKSTLPSFFNGMYIVDIRFKCVANKRDQ